MQPPTSPVPSSSGSRPSTPADNNSAIPDSADHEPDLPLTMASSMIITHLPRDAAKALSSAADFPKPKVTVHFKAVGSSPELKRKLCQISSTQRFEVVVSYLRRTLKVGDMDSVFLYVNSSFAPALDEIVGNLHRVSDFVLLQRVGFG
jgi:ubiquitin-like protein ATG12